MLRTRPTRSKRPRANQAVLSRSSELNERQGKFFSSSMTAKEISPLPPLLFYGGEFSSPPPQQGRQNLGTRTHDTHKTPAWWRGRREGGGTGGPRHLPQKPLGHASVASSAAVPPTPTLVSFQSTCKASQAVATDSVRTRARELHVRSAAAASAHFFLRSSLEGGPAPLRADDADYCCSLVGEFRAVARGAAMVSSTPYFPGRPAAMIGRSRPVTVGMARMDLDGQCSTGEKEVKGQLWMKAQERFFTIIGNELCTRPGPEQWSNQSMNCSLAFSLSRLDPLLMDFRRSRCSADESDCEYVCLQSHYLYSDAFCHHGT